MLAHAVAGAFDLHDDGMMQEPVEQRGGEDGIAEHVAPFGKTPVRGEDHRSSFVPRIDQLEEQVAAAGCHRQVADLVNDEQRRPTEEAYALAQSAFSLGLGELGDEIGERDEVDELSGAHRLDGQRSGEMALALPCHPRARANIRLNAELDVTCERPLSGNEDDLSKLATFVQTPMRFDRRVQLQGIRNDSAQIAVKHGMEMPVYDALTVRIPDRGGVCAEGGKAQRTLKGAQHGSREG